jgi:hypothetical protein
MITDTKEELLEQVAELAREKSVWKKKYEELELKHEALKEDLVVKKHELLGQSQIIVQKTIQLQEKDAALRRDPKRMRYNMDLFSSPDSD